MFRFIGIPKLQFFLIYLSFFTDQLVTDCPRLCECKWKSGKESVICTNANLSSVPLHLDSGTQILDLTSNIIPTIKHDEFSQAGLLNLQKIYISKCRLKNLDRYSFRHLINLVELDLTYNILPSIPSHVFESIPELRELKLSGNPIQRITNDAFAHVPQLVRLELSDCKIGTIEGRAFGSLEKSLEWLKLDKNRLVEVKPSSFINLQSLHGLELAGNPWNCSCKLRPLREWMLKQNVPFGIPPVCRYPNRLASKTWDKLDLDEFACVPEILAMESKAHGIEGKNVTMTCNIAGVPEPNVKWFLKNKVIANLSGTPYSNGRKLYMVHLQNSSSDLTILAADVQDAGVYVCAAENKAGKVEASVTLAVSRRPPETTLSGKVLIASLISGTLFVLSSSLIALCVCTVRRKQSAQWRSRACRRDDNYEKIEMNHKVVGAAKRDSVSNDISVVGPRRNGDYRLVSGTECERETDKDPEAARPKPAAASVPNNSRDPKLWSPNQNGFSPEKKWNSPELPLLDTEDLHIPRRNINETREDCQKNLASTFGTYNIPLQASTNLMSNYSNKPLLADYEQKTPLYATSHNSELSCLIEEDAEKNYPDLIEESTSPFKYNAKSFAKASSEGGSVTDLSDLYCTLPRKTNLLRKDYGKYSSTDSQSPLLPESRYGSSGGESSGESRDSLTKRLSDTQRYMSNNGNNRVGQQRSSSYLNLISTKTSGPPSPIQESQTPDPTPLLDISTLDNRVTYRREIMSPSTSLAATTLSNSYGYHAAQLERFLEEYRCLQKELTKMKETCDNLTKEKAAQRAVDPLLSKTPSNTPSSSTDITRNFMKSPTSPNFNNQNPLQSNYQSDLPKYLRSRNSSSSPSPYSKNDICPVEQI